MRDEGEGEGDGDGDGDGDGEGEGEGEGEEEWMPTACMYMHMYMHMHVHMYMHMHVHMYMHMHMHMYMHMYWRSGCPQRASAQQSRERRVVCKGRSACHAVPPSAPHPCLHFIPLAPSPCRTSIRLISPPSPGPCTCICTFFMRMYMHIDQADLARRLVQEHVARVRVSVEVSIKEDRERMHVKEPVHKPWRHLHTLRRDGGR